MFKRTLSKRTCGIENKVWLEKCGSTCLVLHISLYFVMFYEMIQNIVVLRIVGKMGNPSDVVVTFHVLLYLLFGFSTSAVLMTFKEKQTENRIKYFLIGVPASMVFVILYLFNPWISYYQNDAVMVYIWFKYYFICAKLLLPIFLTSFSIATWILWRMRRVQLDYEPFEVIYGGENSSVKKMIKIV